MKIAVCLIVYNGMPYIGKWLDHYANCPGIDYVCVAEGATQNMVDALDLHSSNSNDGTIDILKQFSAHQKIFYTCAIRPYPEKCEQQNAYIDLVPADTDYIWVADCDEFYHYSDILKIRSLLETDGYTYVQFMMYHFWKEVNTIAVGGSGWGYDQPIDRIFKYHSGAKFLDHRPIRMNDQIGRSVKDIKPLMVANNPVMCYHYSYVTEKNVHEKMLYYTKTFNRDYIRNWFNPVWKAWNHENRYDIESRYSIHPTVPGATTKYVNLLHPVNVDNF